MHVVPPLLPPHCSCLRRTRADTVDRNRDGMDNITMEAGGNRSFLGTPLKLRKHADSLAF
jgi:hypothetical protein